eukprot:TRINITY_DN6949_c0_g3_i1.p1 TRINITY_DN6949_c0_g3~~TRINITY_DN6949_c0_g3_i1.p1  ORF type:complete len:444 (+),score=116.47 TRINITY_DN6949_c0_g3_i1:61-1332(+)
MPKQEAPAAPVPSSVPPYAVLRGLEGDVSCAGVLDTAGLVLTGSAAGELSVWELSTRRALIAVPPQHAHNGAGLLAVSWLPGALSASETADAWCSADASFLSMGRDGLVRIWGFASAEGRPATALAAAQTAGAGEPTCEAASPPEEAMSELVFSWGGDAVVRVRLLCAIQHSSYNFCRCVFLSAAGGSFLAVPCADGAFRIAASGTPRVRPEAAEEHQAIPLRCPPPEGVKVGLLMGLCVAVTGGGDVPDTLVPVGCYESGHVAVWALQLGLLHEVPPPPVVVQAHDETGLCGAAAPRERHPEQMVVVTGGADTKLCVWGATLDGSATPKMKSLGAVTLPAPGVAAVAFRPGDPRVAAAACWDRMLRLVDVRKRTVLAVLSHHSGTVSDCCFARIPRRASEGHATLLVSTAADTTIALWDVCK